MKYKVTDAMLKAAGPIIEHEYNNQLCFRDWGQYGLTVEQRNAVHEKLTKIYIAMRDAE